MLDELLPSPFGGQQVVFALHGTVATNVQAFDPPLTKNPAQQQPAMAPRGVLLAAHQGDATFRGGINDPGYPLNENRRLRHAPVEHERLVVVKLVPVRLPAELPPQKHVLHASAFHMGLDHLPVELRRKPRKRAGPHVENDPYLVRTQKIEKQLQLVIGMAYREYARWLHGINSRPAGRGQSSRSLVRHTAFRGAFDGLDVLVERAAGSFEGWGCPGGAALGQLGVGDGYVDAVGLGVDGH